MPEIKFGVRLGSDSITVYKEGAGIILNEKIIMGTKQNFGFGNVLYLGNECLNSELNLKFIEPFKNYEIIDEKNFIVYLRNILNRILKTDVSSKLLTKTIKIVVAVPSALSLSNLLKIRRVFRFSGISKVDFVQNAVAIQNESRYSSDDKNLIVTIGKCFTDITYLSNSDIIKSRMVYLGGNNMNEGVKAFIYDNKGIDIDENMAEKLKDELSSLYENDTAKTNFEYVGENGDKLVGSCSAKDIKISVTNVYKDIFNEIKVFISQLDETDRNYISKNGIIFAGGCSNIPGMYEFAKKEFECPIYVENAKYIVAIGAGNLTKKELRIKINV